MGRQDRWPRALLALGLSTLLGAAAGPPLDGRADPGLEAAALAPATGAGSIIAAIDTRGGSSAETPSRSILRHDPIAPPLDGSAILARGALDITATTWGRVKEFFAE